MQCADAPGGLGVILHEIAGGLSAANGGDAPEEAVHAAPFGQELSGAPAMGFFAVPLDDGAQALQFPVIVDALQINQLGIGSGGEDALHIQHVSYAGRHARAEVLAGFAEHYHDTAGHVFAGVRAHALYYGQRAAIAHCETLARASCREELTAGCAIKGGIAQDGILVGGETGVGWRRDDDLTAGHTFTDVVVGFATEDQAHTGDAEGSEALACRTCIRAGDADTG